MTTLRITLLLLTLTLGTAASGDTNTGETAPLFASNEVLDVTIRAPFKTIMRERSDDTDTSATLSYNDAEAGEVTVEVSVRTRGRFRRRSETCSWAPLRLNFKKKSVRNTLFAGSDKMKLVTHCRKSGAYFRALQSEFLAYRILNMVTDNSFRVRMMRVTYVDTDNKDREYTQYGFTIEQRDQLAKRIGLDLNEVARSQIGNLDPGHTNLTSLHQYLIGNTDFSPIRAPAGEPCCHNYVLFGEENGRIVPIPYDFDMSGLVDAPHASPSPNFKITDVRDRLYRGRCVNNEHVAGSVQAFIDNKENIYDLVTSNEIYKSKGRRAALEYLDDFYDVIESPARVQSSLIDKCIGPAKPASPRES